MRRILLAAIMAGAVTGPALAQCDTRFTLVNRSGVTVNEFYFGPSTNSNWGIMDVVGTGLTVWGRVTGKQDIEEGYGLVMLDVGIVNPDGQESTPGKAIVVLPKKDGSVPYPFVPPARLVA